MPTVLRIEAYRFYFFSHEPNEPPHVHIDRNNLTAKFWLQPVSLANNLAFSAKEVRKLEMIVQENKKIWEFWNGYFSNSGGPES